VERAIFVPDLDRLPPPGAPGDRLYLGNEFCPWRLPGERELLEAHTAAARRGMTFSLVTPFLDEPGLVHTHALVRALPADLSTEVVVNDLGLVVALRASGWNGTVVAGRLLTRQRRGPGFQSFGDVPPEAGAALRGSVLDSPNFIGLLGSRYGVLRFELDDLVQGVAVPSLPSGVSLSLYRPWLLVTATRNCPWVFGGPRWRREGICLRPCKGRALRLDPSAEGSDVLRAGCGGPAPRNSAALPSVHAGVGGDASNPATATALPATRPLILGGCAQFLENRSDAPPPPGVDRIVWQPEVPA
jgi:hypothetical protein